MINSEQCDAKELKINHRGLKLKKQISKDNSECWGSWIEVVYIA